METVKYDLDEMHAVQKQLLLKVMQVCEEKELTWFLGFGSLLGAVRNHRIIDWDDSIDIVMPWADYDTLVRLPQSVWGEELFLQTYDTDPQYPKYYAKLRDSRTTLIKADYTAYDMNHGIYINIIPLIHLADDDEQRRKQIRDAKLYKAVTEGTQLPLDAVALKVYSSLLLDSSEKNRRRWQEDLKGRVLSCEDVQTVNWFALAGDKSLTLTLPSGWFASAKTCEFEGMEVRIPRGWEEWLTLRYGDYMVAPISELRGDKISQFVVLNTKRPYTEYKGKAYCLEG